jgi:hypothetical protein
MRHWNPLFLVPVLAVVLATVVSTTPPGASAHSFPATSMTFKGKIVAKNAATHYFVLSFTCSDGKFSAGWTYEFDSTHSFTGTVGSATCSFSSTGGLVTTPSPLNLMGAPCAMCTPTLTVTLMNIMATKTFFNIPMPPPPATPTEICSSSATPQPCLDVETSGFNIPNPTPPPTNLDDFNSQCTNFTCPTGFPYATLNFSAR